MPPLRFFRSQLAHRAAPAVTYYIRGTSSNVGGTETFNIQFIQDGAVTPDTAETITVDVDANGDWEYEYTQKKIAAFNVYANNTMTSIEFTEDLMRCTNLYRGFCQTKLQSIKFSAQTTLENLVICDLLFCDSNQLTAIDMPNVTFGSATNFWGMFARTKLSTIDISKFIFPSGTKVEAMFQQCTSLTTIIKRSNQFENCGVFDNFLNRVTQMSTIDFSDETFENATSTLNMFSQCRATTIKLDNATFNKVIIAQSMFANCTYLTNLTIPKATFKNATTGKQIFNFCTALPSLSMPLATFEKVTDMWGAFSSIGCTSISLPIATFALLQNAQYLFQDAPAVQTIELTSATMGNVTNSQFIFTRCNVLANLDVPQNSTAILPTSTPTNAPMDITQSPLNYTSMLKVANWLSDLTGQSAHTCTFNATAWNALTAAEQSNIDTILSGKNWTRAIA